MGRCSQAVGVTSNSELQSASQGGVADARTAGGRRSWEGPSVEHTGAHRSCGGGCEVGMRRSLCCT
eukprot:435651-Amphidinium_carterae.1